MSKLAVHWIGPKPPDAAEWEQIIEERAQDTLGVGAVKIRNVGHGWWLEAARIGHIGIGAGPTPPEIGPPLDFRSHIHEALRSRGKSAIGREAMEGHLSEEEVMAIRAAANDLAPLDPQVEVGFDQQPVLDLLAELERLRQP